MRRQKRARRVDVGIVYTSFGEASSVFISSSWHKCLGNRHAQHTTVPSVVDGGCLRQSGHVAIQLGAPDVSIHVDGYTMK